MAYNTRLEFRIWRPEPDYSALVDTRSEPDEIRTVWADEVRGSGGAAAIGFGVFDELIETRLERAATPNVTRTFRCRTIPASYYSGGDGGTLAVVRLRGEDWAIDSVTGLNARQDEITLRKR